MKDCPKCGAPIERPALQAAHTPPRRVTQWGECECGVEFRYGTLEGWERHYVLNWRERGGEWVDADERTPFFERLTAEGWP